MPLPIQPLPMIERWDCHQCGNCCRGSVIPLSPDDLERLKSQKWEDREEYKQVAVTARESWLGHAHRLAQRPDGSCVFLTREGLCRIHQEFGEAAKPLVCRIFPLQIVPRDNVAYLTVRRACPSAAADLGRPIAEHLELGRQLARERHLADASPNPPLIKPGETRDWPVAKRLLETLQRILTDQRYPPVRRLVHALIFCRLLETAKTRPLSDDRLIELLNVLEQNVAGEVGDLFTERQQPASAAQILFRQTAAEFIRLYPGLAAQPTWRERMGLAWAAWKMVSGRGALPRLHPAFPHATFEQLEQPLGVLDPSIYQPLNRQLETAAVSWVYALANRPGWSIIDSLRMLALSYPIALYLLRWRSANSTPQPNYIIEIITALDRGQGYGPLSGAKQCRRVRIMAHLQELEKIVIWYAR